MHGETVETCKNDQAASLRPDLSYVLQRFAPDLWKCQGWPQVFDAMDTAMHWPET